MSKTIRELWQDPQYWERMIEVIRETWRSPVLREWRAMAVRERFQDPEVRERQKKGLNRHFGLVAIGRAMCEKAGLEPMPNDELAMLAEMFLEQTGVKP